MIDEVAYGPATPARSAVAITPDDNTDLARGATRGLYIGGGGDVTVIMADDSAAVTLAGLVAGVVHPLRVKRVKATGTTATGIVGLF
jgi:hypothetical protein